MHIITFFAPKGGTGRTTALMAMASGLIAANQSVAVLDISEQGQPGSAFHPSVISRFEDRMVETGVAAGRFATAPAWDSETCFNALSRFRREGFDTVLVDTSAQTNPLSVELLENSDLVIMPFTGPLEAALLSKWLAANPQPVNRTFGLETGIEDDEDARFARKMFAGAPVLNAALPMLDALGHQFQKGHLHGPRFRRNIAADAIYNCPIAADEWAQAKAATDALCAEITGLLTRRNGSEYPVNAPLPDGTAGELLMMAMSQIGGRHVA